MANPFPMGLGADWGICAPRVVAASAGSLALQPQKKALIAAPQQGPESNQ
jgi:hypothetical protein